MDGVKRLAVLRVLWSVALAVVASDSAILVERVSQHAVQADVQHRIEKQYAPDPTPLPTAPDTTSPLLLMGEVDVGLDAGDQPEAGDWVATAGGGCVARGAYTFLRAGTAVVIEDQATSAVVARTTLQPGAVTQALFGTVCAFAFQAIDVPHRARYRVQVAGLEPTYGDYASFEEGPLTLVAQPAP